MRQLNTQNEQLVEKLKSMNAQADSAMRRMKKNKSKLKINAEMSEIHLDSEKESLFGQEKMYTREVEILKAKIARRSGPGRIIELEKNIATRRTGCEEMTKELKAKEKGIRDLQKRIAKWVSGEAKELFNLEVYFAAATKK